jgi:hypothetical protein
MTKLLTSAKGASILAAVSALVLCSVALAQMTPPPTNGAGTPTAFRLQERVLRANELESFVPIACALPETDVAQWANGDSAAIASLRSDGFVMGLREPLYSRLQHANAISVAAKFRAPQGASNDVGRQLASAREAGAVTTFAVAGIPGAHGFTLSANRKVGYRVVFTSGAYEYLVAVEFPHAQSSGPSTAPLLKAAQLVYSRAVGGGTPRIVHVAVSHK